MADFQVVHQRELNEAAQNLRKRNQGNIWSIALREPLRFDAPMSDTVTVIQICIGADRKLHPFDARSGASLKEWRERHKETANEEFELPEGVTDAVGTSPSPSAPDASIPAQRPRE